MSAVFNIIFSIYSGVVPQHPPSICAPLLHRLIMVSAKSSGLKLYSVLPSIIAGSPALGLTIIGSDEYFSNSAIISTILSGPNEQFMPSALTPRPSSIAIIALGAAPVISLPDRSYALVTNIGKSQFSFAAITAALVSNASFMVSIRIKSISQSLAIFMFSV